MANEAIRAYAKENGVPLWKIAEVLQISEFTFSRKLRHELSREDRFLVESIIKKLSTKTSDQS